MSDTPRRVVERPSHANVHDGRSVWHVARGKLRRGEGPDHCPRYIHCGSRWWRYETFPAGPPLDKESGMPVEPMNQKLRHDSGGWPAWMFVPAKERIHAD